MLRSIVNHALEMSVLRRKPPQGLVFHSDRGCQYASQLFRGTIARCKMKQSMSRKGNYWDNACAESFFSTLKTELIGKYIFHSRSEAQSAIFEYIEIFYNRTILHSTLDYLSPDEYEKQRERLASWIIVSIEASTTYFQEQVGIWIPPVLRLVESVHKIGERPFHFCWFSL